MKLREELTTEKKRFRFWLAVAAGVHIMFFLSVFAWQHFFVTQKPVLKIVSVSLVSLPGAGGSPMPASSEGESKEQEEGDQPESISVEEPVAAKMPERKQVEKVNAPAKKPESPKQNQEQTKPIVPVKSVPQSPIVKREEPQAPSRKESLDRALDKYRSAVDAAKGSAGKQRQDNLGSALARLQQNVASRSSGKGGGSGHSAGVPGGMGTGRGGGGTADHYMVKVASIIQKNWEFSDKMVQNSYGMEVYVHIFVLPDGTINEIRYDRRAPSEYLNNSVKKALEKSSPLPPVPGEYGSRGRSIGFVFTPEGISK